MDPEEQDTTTLEVDMDDDSVTVDPESVSGDTGEADLETPDTHTLDDQGDAPTAGTDPETPDTLTSRDESLTPQEQTTPTDYERRYRDLQSYSEQRYRQATEQQQRLQAELEHMRRQQQEMTERQNLRPWNRQHPEHQRFQRAFQRLQIANEQRRNLDPNMDPQARQAAEAAIFGSINADDRKMLEEYQQNVQEFQQNFHTDPQGTLTPMLQGMVEQQISQVFERQAAEQKAQALFQRPEYSALMQDPATRDWAVDFITKTRNGEYNAVDLMTTIYSQAQQIEQLRRGQQPLQRQAVQASEQQRLAQTNAAAVRDSAPAPAPSQVDLLAEAKKLAADRGVPTTGAAFMHILTEVQAQHGA